MVAVNVTYALASAIDSSMRSVACSIMEVGLLTDQSHSESPLRKFTCLVPLHSSPPLFCDTTFYSELSPQCATCTFAQITEVTLSCFEICSTGASSDFCRTCVNTFLSSWMDGCTLHARDSAPPLSPLLCESLEKQRDDIAYQLSVCLAVNETRAIDCMMDNGFSNIPKDCSNCLFSSQYISDTVCYNLCVYRPYSGNCLQCINAYVSNSIRNCFLMNSYAMTTSAACTVSDMSLIGPSGNSVDRILRSCISSVSCLVSRSGYLVPGEGTVSNDCIQCIHTGETKSGNSCTDNACANITTDCGFAPSIGALEEISCSREDVAAFSPNSPQFRSINNCLYTAQNRTNEAVINCLKVPDNTLLNTTLSANCQSCMSSVLANSTSCVPTCDAYGHESVACQECVGTLLSFSLSSCFGTATSDVCSLNEATNVAYKSWSLAVLQRCLLYNNFTNIPNCMIEAGFSSPTAHIDLSFDCRNCMSLFLIHSEDCQSSCLNGDADSNECRRCTTQSLTGMIQNCTRNASLFSSIPETRGFTESQIIFSIALIFITISIH